MLLNVTNKKYKGVCHDTHTLVILNYHFVEKRNKHTKKNCAPSWLYLQDYTELHGQQNIKKKNISSDVGPVQNMSPHNKIKSFMNLIEE
jgi:hypothetical protein